MVVDVQSADSDVVFVATVHAFALLSDTENPLAAVDVAAIVLLLPAIAAISNSLQDPLMVQCSTGGSWRRGQCGRRCPEDRTCCLYPVQCLA